MKISRALLSQKMKQTPMIIINQPYIIKANLQLKNFPKTVIVKAPNIYPTIIPITANECKTAIHLVFDFLGENSLTHTGA
jgi:hypothetical protein